MPALSNVLPRRKPPERAAAKITRERSQMHLALDELYPRTPECIVLLFDLRDPEACEQVHRLRAVWQEDSDLEALGPEHMILFLFPGAQRVLP